MLPARKLASSSLFRAPCDARPAEPRTATPAAVRVPHDAQVDRLAREFLEQTEDAATSLPEATEPEPQVELEPAGEPIEAPALGQAVPSLDDEAHARDTAPPPPGYEELPRESGIRATGRSSFLPAAAVDEVIANIRRDSRFEE